MVISTLSKPAIKQAEMNQSKHDTTPVHSDHKLSRSIGDRLAAKGWRHLHMLRPHRLAYQAKQRFMHQAKPTLKVAQTIQLSTGEIDLRELAKIARQTSQVHQLQKYMERTINTTILINRRSESE